MSKARLEALSLGIPIGTQVRATYTHGVLYSGFRLVGRRRGDFRGKLVGYKESWVQGELRVSWFQIWFWSRPAYRRYRVGRSLVHRWRRPLKCRLRYSSEACQ